MRKRYYSESEKNALLRDWKTQKSVLAELGEDTSKYVRRLVAKHTNTSLAILQKLACDPEETVRIEVAKNMTIDKRIMDILAKDKSEFVIEALASNINITKPVIDALCVESKFPTVYFGVKMKLAGNVKTPKTILARLAKEELPTIKMAVVQNVNTDVETLRLLATDIDPEVAQYAQLRIIGMK